MARRRRSADRVLQHRGVRAAGGRGDLRQRAAQRRAEARASINWNLALFKNFSVGGSTRVRSIRARGLQSCSTTVEFQDIDRTARFDATGAQINPNFGTAIGIAQPDAPAARHPVVRASEFLRLP